MCGSGTHPGGGVMGAPGALCAKTMLGGEACERPPPVGEGVGAARAARLGVPPATEPRRGRGKTVTATVVIGAGLNGLTCATLLAKKGHKVVVLEAREAAGGIAAPFEFHPGYRSAGLLHDTSGLRPRAVSQLALEQHGLRLRTRRPICSPWVAAVSAS